MIRFNIILGIILIQGLFAGIAITYKTDKFTDLSYGGTFVLLSTYLLLNYGDSIPDYMVFFLLIVRGFRIAFYLFMRIVVIKKDDRFDGIREKKRSFMKFRVMQAIVIFLLMVGPILQFKQQGLGLHRLSVIGFFIALFGIGIETTADWQKFTYKRQNPAHWADKGLRAKARHPNYFGEMLMRWGLYFCILPYLSGWGYLAIIGPFSITRLLFFVTGIPPLEEQWEKKYGEDGNFQERKKRTNLLVPW